MREINMIDSIHHDFSHVYILDNKEYYFKGKRNYADRAFIDTLIKTGKVKYKKVFDYKI